MNCHDAREWFSDLLGGRIALTEWALFEAHLSQCTECRQEEARRRQVVAARHVTPPRVLLNSLSKVTEVTRINLTWSAGLVVRLLAFLAAALELTARTMTGVIEAIGLGISHSLDLIARLRAVLAGALELTWRAMTGVIKSIARGIPRFVVWTARLRALLAIPFSSSGRAGATVIRAVCRAVTRSAERAVRLRPLPAIPLWPSVRAAGVVLALALALALYALPRTSALQQSARSEPAPSPELEPASTMSVLPPPPVESDTVSRAAPRIDGPRPAPSRPAALSSPRGPALEAAREAPGPTTLATHVVGRLSARDPRVAERDFTALLAGVGGTELGRHHRVTFTSVEVVVPQSRYEEFARGLARIGSWRLEALRLPLPEAVHMTIRVGE